MNDPDGWEGDETAERLWFDNAQEALKADKEAYDAWIDELIREGFHEAFRAD